MFVETYILNDIEEIDCKEVVRDKELAIVLCLNDEEKYYDLRSFDEDFMCW